MTNFCDEDLRLWTSKTFKKSIFLRFYGKKNYVFSAKVTDIKPSFSKYNYIKINNGSS